MKEFLRIAAPIVLFLAGPAPLRAHDLWIIPESFRPRPASTAAVEVRIGETFPVSMNAPSASFTRFALVSAAGEAGMTDARKQGKALVARFLAPSEGTAAIVLEGPPRHIELPPDVFKDYVLHEGLAHVHEERIRRGETARTGREDYSRHAKALIRPAAGGGVATRPAGLELELVPALDPYDLGPGQPLPVTVLFGGKPLAGVELRAYAEGGPVHRVRTAEDGTAILVLDRAGPWCVAFIHSARCTDCPNAEWRSYFGTLVFELPTGPAAPATRETP